MIRKVLLFTLLIAGTPMVSAAQVPVVAPDLSKPNPNAWLTYHGDYSGRHFSPLKQINISNVRNLSLAWAFRFPTTDENAIVTASPVSQASTRPSGFPPLIKSIPIVDEGLAYFTTPGHAYAVNLRTGHMVWHHVWQGRTTIGNRGLAIAGDSLYMETPDNFVIAIDKHTGKELWHKPIAEKDASNSSTAAPIVVKNHLILGVAGDSGRNNGWLEARDLKTGEFQWRWYTTPKEGEPGIETWPNTKAAELGAGGPWQPPTYDPELNLIYVTTGNPTATFNGLGRAGANLYTCSVVALNADTGKLVWYYQISPHDTHDWDATEVPVLLDGTIDGKPRKLLATANRNGYYFLLDRVTGKKITLQPMLKHPTGFKGIDNNGVLIPDPENEPSQAGVLVSPDSDGATNYPAQSFDPETGFFYTNLSESAAIFYLNIDKNDPTGFAARGREYRAGLRFGSLLALDYKTGIPKWRRDYPEDAGFYTTTYPGMLSTGGGILFTGDPSNDFIAFDAKTGKALWHSRLTGLVSNSPVTFMMDSKQYIVVGAGDTLYSFVLQ